MGFCTNCGRPCPACSGEVGDFSLLALPKETRHLIKVVLEKMGMYNETDLSILVQKLLPYKSHPKVICNAMKEYLILKNAPRSIPYLVAIVKGKAVHMSNQSRLDALPPRAPGYEKDKE
jgi:hypothetical protein